ncbi:MAG: phosphocholine cytidylyltransferase family protein [Lachnospiraceae bacterium]|nr:phosphocholine cytidylyltransferase family protein [Lachnospiraceae bacterium]
MKVIILAAGQGKRLETYTQGKPKCLLKLGNETILEREIRLLKECGFTDMDIYIVGGYQYHLLEPYAKNLIINDKYNIKDNSYSLGLALEIINDDILVLDADLCFDVNIIKEILIHKEKNVLLSKKSNDLLESTGIVTTELERVLKVGKEYKNTGYIYISIFKMEKERISEFRKLLLNEKNEVTWYTRAITELCEKYKFYNCVTESLWSEIDFVEDYIETLQLFHLEK